MHDDRGMKRFHWRAQDLLGNRLTGKLWARSAHLASKQLGQRGLREISLSSCFYGSAVWFGEDIAPQRIALFTRQLATMMNAGIPLLHCLTIVIDELEPSLMRATIADLRTSVEAGESFSHGLRNHPRVFNRLYCNLVEVGESSGTLAESLERLARFREDTELLKAKIRKALAYPVAVIGLSILAAVVMLTQMVPKLAATFADFGADIPPFTLAVMRLSDATLAHGWEALATIAALCFVLRRLLRDSQRTLRLLERLQLNLPVVGRVTRAACCARFCRALETSYAAGVPLADALSLSANAISHSLFEESSQRIRAEVASGVPLHKALQASGQFPPIVGQMVCIGEESGTLDTMLAKCAGLFEEEVDAAVDSLTSLIEPAIIVVIGILVGGLVVAMYLPLFQLGNLA